MAGVFILCLLVYNIFNFLLTVRLNRGRISRIVNQLEIDSRKEAREEMVPLAVKPLSLVSILL